MKDGKPSRLNKKLKRINRPVSFTKVRIDVRKYALNSLRCARALYNIAQEKTPSRPIESKPWASFFDWLGSV